MRGFNGFPSTTRTVRDLARGITPTSNVSFGSIANITDGNDGTLGASQSVSTPQYVQVDLGAARRINRVHLLHNDLIHRSNAGALQLSQNGTDFTDVASWSANTYSLEREHVLDPPQVARYVRVNTTQTGSPGGSGVEYYTIEVWGY